MPFGMVNEFSDIACDGVLKGGTVLPWGRQALPIGVHNRDAVDDCGGGQGKAKGTVRISVCGRRVEHQAAMALVKRSPKMTAN